MSNEYKLTLKSAVHYPIYIAILKQFKAPNFAIDFSDLKKLEGFNANRLVELKNANMVYKDRQLVLWYLTTPEWKEKDIAEMESVLTSIRTVRK